MARPRRTGRTASIRAASGVHSSLDPKIQQAAETALRDGLVRYDHGKGWSGPIAQIEEGAGWTRALNVANIGVGYADWRAAVVTEKKRRRGDARVRQRRDRHDAGLGGGDAQARRRGHAYDFMKVGDVIAVKRDGDTWTLRNIPAISAGWSSRIRTASRAGDAGRVRRPRRLVQPRHAGAAAARIELQAVRLRDLRSTTA